MELQLSEWIHQREQTQGITIDVRTAIEREEGFIKEALHLDFYNAPQFVEHLLQLDKDKSYFLYCQLGMRSKQASIVMRNYGFTKVYSLSGGYHTYISN